MWSVELGVVAAEGRCVLKEALGIKQLLYFVIQTCLADSLFSRVKNKQTGSLERSGVRDPAVCTRQGLPSSGRKAVSAPWAAGPGLPVWAQEEGRVALAGRVGLAWPLTLTSCLSSSGLAGRAQLLGLE